MDYALLAKSFYKRSKVSFIKRQETFLFKFKKEEEEERNSLREHSTLVENVVVFIVDIDSSARISESIQCLYACIIRYRPSLNFMPHVAIATRKHYRFPKID